MTGMTGIVFIVSFKHHGPVFRLELNKINSSIVVIRTKRENSAKEVDNNK